MKKVFVSLLGLSALAVASFANQVTLTYVGPNPPIIAYLDLSSTSYKVNIGKLNFHDVTDNTNLTTICSDLIDGLNGNPHTYNVSFLPPGGTAGQQKAAHIVSTYFNSALTFVQQAGLQLAVWDAVYNDPATFDLSNASAPLKLDTTQGHSGFYDFSTNNYGNLYAGEATDILNYASTYYGATSGGATWYQHVDAGGQDQMAVPEPTSFGVLALGLVGLIRRKFKKA